MKKLLLVICGGALLLAGCKEHDMSIGLATTAVTDTSYVVSPVPMAGPHQVLVEEFTGQGCSNCPAAHADLDGISAMYPGLINVVSMYIWGPTTTIPPANAIYDFRDSVATNISNTIYGGISELPIAGIDRVSINGNIQQGRGVWDNNIPIQLNVIDSLNLIVSSSYDAAAKTASITAMVTYTQPVSTPQNLSIVIVEDSMVDIQEDGNAAGGYDTNFLFLDVFRGMVTSVPWGDVLQVKSATPNVKEAGRFFQKTYYYALPAKTPAFVPAHCRVIAFVNNANGADLHVMQSAQCKLAP